MDIHSILKENFKLKTFRPAQENVCKTIIDGSDVLLVMPTGAGKSLCYQLPAVARTGTTLVVSPLIALIEDQIQKLKTLGLAAERIHSGLSRIESREICRLFLDRKLQFLFISPERLGVPGFLDFLIKAKPNLIAIDEAHCISKWGHDFRPDYRLLGERIKEFRPAPIVAMTATATPLVQDDICTQLGLQKEVRFIEGFRRENLGVHILEADPKTRPETILNILNEPKNLPAIIYAPTRKKAEELCEFFSDDFKISYYHAGMTAEDRSKVQSEYLTGKTDIIVATIAFGMGIDKPNVRTVIHAGLPGSIESYYQEIGRAGRDGKESNAFLLYTYADQKTHEYFFKMSYPEVAEIKKIHNILTKKFQTKDELFSQLKKMNSNTFLKGLEQLKVHQGALINFNEEVAIGKSSWTKTYQVQLRHKENELLKILEFVKTNKCRMHLLVSHFGEKSNANHKCGKCDICNPTLKKNFEVNFELTDADEKLALKIVQVVKEEQPLAAGKLFLFLSKNRPKLKRGHFEKIVSELSNRGKLKVQEEVFEKDGKIIEYRKISLGAKVSQNWW